MPFGLTTVSVYLHNGQPASAELAMGSPIIASDTTSAMSHQVEMILNSLSFVMLLCPIN
jgi:hypothetical protein